MVRHRTSIQSNDGAEPAGRPRSHWPLMIALNIALFLAVGWLVWTRLVTAEAAA